MYIPCTLSATEERRLHEFTRTGTHNAREICRAEILLLAHAGNDDTEIAARVRRHERTVSRVRRRFHEGGLDRALFDAPRSGQPRKTDDADDAHLVALACSDAPKGSDHWTLALLAKRFKRDRKKKLGTSAIWLRLKTRGIKPWREKNVVHAGGHPRVH